jgi:hypothetical protein
MPLSCFAISGVVQGRIANDRPGGPIRLGSCKRRIEQRQRA